MAESRFTLRPLTVADRDWVRRILAREWGAETVVVHQAVYHPADLPGLVAEAEGKVIGLLIYHIENQACEIVTLNSWGRGMGVGTTLIEAMKGTASREGCRRLWLVTTNDNTRALRFYQKRGFTICAVRLNIMDQSRKIKPEIPPTGEDDIPIRDEIELEMQL